MAGNVCSHVAVRRARTARTPVLALRHGPQGRGYMPGLDAFEIAVGSRSG